MNFGSSSCSRKNETTGPTYSSNRGQRTPCRASRSVARRVSKRTGMVQVLDRLARRARRTCLRTGSNRSEFSTSFGGTRIDGSRPAYSRASERNSSRGGHRLGVDQVQRLAHGRLSPAAAAIASTMKSTGTTLNGASARPNVASGASPIRAIVRRM